ncbi:MAG: GNAT family N-acetyltransferase [Anaerolineales bacterium]|nr:GNAT family N-acetyltransferase [Anaerolineales bacterium]
MVDMADVRRRLGLAIERADHCPFQWLLGLCVDWIPEGWEAVAGEYALESVATTIGMATDHLQPPRRSLPKMEYRRIQDEATARDLAELNMHAYRLPPELGECICNLHLWKEDSYGYVGYVDSQPVTCAATFPVNDTIYVAFVATHPNERRKGYAEAVIRHSIEQGAQGMGLHRTALHATEAGFPLYICREAARRGRVIHQPRQGNSAPVPSSQQLEDVGDLQPNRGSELTAHSMRHMGISLCCCLWAATQARR